MLVRPGAADGEYGRKRTRDASLRLDAIVRDRTQKDASRTSKSSLGLELNLFGSQASSWLDPLAFQKCDSDAGILPYSPHSSKHLDTFVQDRSELWLLVLLLNRFKCLTSTRLDTNNGGLSSISYQALAMAVTHRFDNKKLASRRYCNQFLTRSRHEQHFCSQPKLARGKSITSAVSGRSRTQT